MSASESFPCPYCEIGQCQLSERTYLGIYNGLFVSAPDTPFWECDICQHQEFDGEAIKKLEILLDADDTSRQRGTNIISPNDTKEPCQVRRVKP